MHVPFVPLLRSAYNKGALPWPVEQQQAAFLHPTITDSQEQGCFSRFTTRYQVIGGE